MAHAKVNELRAKSDKAWAQLRAQLQGMEPYLDKSDAPGQWTTREVLSHMLFEPGWKPVPLLKTFAHQNLPVIDVKPGDTDASGERQTMTLKQFADALDTQRREVMAYLDGAQRGGAQPQVAHPGLQGDHGHRGGRHPDLRRRALRVPLERPLGTARQDTQGGRTA